MCFSAAPNVSVVAINVGKVLAEKISPFDTFIQIIEGEAEAVIDAEQNVVRTGESIIVPAHTSYYLKAKKRFKMISTVIKSGYEAF